LISKIIILDIQNNYFKYQKLYRTGVLFKISEIVILDIKNKFFRYQKIDIYFGYPKYIYIVIVIVIFDIWNSFLDIRN